MPRCFMSLELLRPEEKFPLVDPEKASDLPSLLTNKEICASCDRLCCQSVPILECPSATRNQNAEAFATEKEDLVEKRGEHSSS